MPHESDVFYHSLEEVREILDSRKSLRREVESWWWESGVTVPRYLADGKGYALIARNVPTFRYEDAAFVVMAEKARLTPSWLGYITDKLVTVSSVKRSLVAPRFITRIGGKGGAVTEYLKVADLKKNSGRALNEVECTDGTRSLVDFHQKQLTACYPRAVIDDISLAWQTLGGRASLYYPYFLSLAASHGVLFEDYHAGESGPVLTDFTRDIFEPAFRLVEEKFGVKPLVVRLPWWPELGSYPHPDLTKVFSWRCHGFALKELAVQV